MPTGFRIADAYVAVRLDRDDLRKDLTALPAQLNGDVDRLGNDLGKRTGKAIGKGLDSESTKVGKSAGDKISRGVEQSINGGRFGESLRKQVDSALKSLPQKNLLNLDVGTTAQLDHLRRELESLSSKRIGVDLSSDDASAKISELERQLTELGSRSANIQVKVDTAAAAAELAAFRTKMARTGGDSGSDFARSLDNALGPAMKRSADDAGGTLSQGMRQSVVRNSPLIVAGIGAALAAGAPVAIAGATALFAGIGIVAAAQSQAVQHKWSVVFGDIASETEQDASVMQGALLKMAEVVQGGFERLRPALRVMFDELGPLMVGFTQSLVNMAQNAMPGLVNAVQAAGPVMAGLGTLMEDIGTGLSGFFDAISQHGDAAGQAFAAIGKILEVLLPVLGDLLGEGAELASIVLPPLAAALGVVADALHVIAPILPEVAAGFLAFKATQGISGILETFGVKAAGVVSSLKGLVSGPGSAVEASSALGSLKGAMGPVGVAFGLIGAAIVASQQQINDWAQALLAGGNAAQQAQAQMSGIENFFNSGFTGVGAAVTGVTNWANALGVGSNASETAKQKAQELYDAMSPLQQAQQDVTTAQNELSAAVDKYGASSPQAAAAADAYRAAQAEVQHQSEGTQLAIEGVTDTMLAQADQALANASSQFAYTSATQHVSDAQQHLADLQTSGKATASDLNNATNSLNQALLSQAEAAGRLASDSLPASASETQKATAANNAMLTELLQLKDTMGAQFPAALDQAIVGLRNSGAATEGMSGQAYNAQGVVQGLMSNLGFLGQQHPVPTVAVGDYASGTLGNITGLLGRIQSKTVTVTVWQSIHTLTAGLVGAKGGVVHAYAQGGFEPMSGRIAQIVPPRTMRVIGDRITDDEAFIPINGAPRSLDILRQTADRMGFGLTPQTPTLPVATSTGTSGTIAKVQGGALGGNTYNVTVNVNGVAFADSVELPRRLTDTISDALRKRDRELR